MAVDKKQRGKGIWKNLINHTDKITYKKYNPSVSLGFTTNPIVINAWKKKDREFPHKINNMIHINDLDKHKKYSNMAWYKQIGYTIYKKIRKVTKNDYVQNKDVKLEFIDSFPRSYDDFWSNKREEYYFTLDRTREYMNWRYCDPRGGNYLVKSVSVNGVFLGYIVIMIDYKNEEYPIGYIVDLLAATNSQNLLDNLIMDSLEYFESKGVNMVQSWVIEGNRNSGYLSDNGFATVNNHWFVMYRRHSDVADIMQLGKVPGSSVYFSNGDADSI